MLYEECAPYKGVEVEMFKEAAYLLEYAVYQLRKIKNGKNSQKVLTGTNLYGSIQKFAADNKFEANGRYPEGYNPSRVTRT